MVRKSHTRRRKVVYNKKYGFEYVPLFERSSSLKRCKNGYIRNPSTRRCVKRNGKIGKRLLKKSSSKRRQSSRRETAIEKETDILYYELIRDPYLIYEFAHTVFPDITEYPSSLGKYFIQQKDIKKYRNNSTIYHMILAPPFYDRIKTLNEHYIEENFWFDYIVPGKDNRAYLRDDNGLPIVNITTGLTKAAKRYAN